MGGGDENARMRGRMIWGWEKEEMRMGGGGGGGGTDSATCSLAVTQSK